MSVFMLNLLNEEFNLRKAVNNNDVDIIFGDSEEFLEELAHIRSKKSMQIIIRNFKEDNTSSHWFSMKFIPARDIKGAIYNEHKGIPIVFEKVEKIENGKIKYVTTDWHIELGGNKGHISNSKNIMNNLNKTEKAFISKVVKDYGIEILEYWALDNDVPEQNKRMIEIREKFESLLIK